MVYAGMREYEAGLTVLSRDGKTKGKTTGSVRHCSMEGCRGLRIYVRWADGKLTMPCTKGMMWDGKNEVWQIQ